MFTVLAALLLSLQVPDSVVRLQGFVEEVPVQPGDTTVFRLALAYPLTVARASVGTLWLTGERTQWSRYVDRFVEAEGRIVAPGALASPRVHELAPPGVVHRDISPSYTQHAVLTLAVVPQQIVWRDSTGDPTGVRAVAYYTIANRGDTQLYFVFTTPEILCISVTRAGASNAHWRDAWRPRERADPWLRVQMGTVVRYLFTLPEAAAPQPGRYTVRVSLCGESDYEMQTDIEVIGR